MKECVLLKKIKTFSLVFWWYWALNYSSKYILTYNLNAVLSLFSRGHQRSGFSLSTEVNWMMTFHSFLQDLAFGNVRYIHSLLQLYCSICCKYRMHSEDLLQVCKSPVFALTDNLVQVFFMWYYFSVSE